ncbi:MAG TPA: dethiobiotin synthase [Steroidobacteraceae bacterium]
MNAAPRGVFITGTDTGVGKTRIAVGLIRALVQQGMQVVGMKPIASGSDLTADGLRNADALALCAAANVKRPYASVNPYCFAPAISPHIAAQEAGVEVDCGLLRAEFQALARTAEFVVVEGAGGWHAPINATQTMADLALGLQIPLLLVVGLRLGCLNHAQLTREALQASGVPFAGWIGNVIDPQFERLEDNLLRLERSLGAAALAVLAFQPHEDPAPALRAAALRCLRYPGFYG